MTTELIKRTFKFKSSGKDVSIDDPAPNYRPEEVLSLLSNQYPELVTATVKNSGIQSGKQVFEFVTTLGTKG